MGTVTGEGGGDAVEATSIGALLFVYLFIYFSHLFPMHWSHLKLPLKDPSQPHLSCFCLHT